MGKNWAIDDRAQLHRDANILLDENLMAGEKVKAIVRGASDSAMIATDRRAFVFKKGWLSGSAFAKKLASWDYRNVTGVQLEIGKLSGTIALQAAGAVAGDAGFWGSGKDDAYKAANALPLHSDHFDQARDGAALIRQLIVASQTPAPAISAATPAPDPIDQLRRLGELRDAGVLTTAEFDAKKADILARL